MQGTQYAPRESILCMEHFVALQCLTYFFTETISSMGCWVVITIQFKFKSTLYKQTVQNLIRRRMICGTTIHCYMYIPSISAVGFLVSEKKISKKFFPL